MQWSWPGPFSHMHFPRQAFLTSCLHSSLTPAFDCLIACPGGLGVWGLYAAEIKQVRERAFHREGQFR